MYNELGRTSSTHVMSHELSSSRASQQDDGNRGPICRPSFPSVSSPYLLSGVIVASNGRVVGALVIRDPIRPEAAVVIEGLRRMGIASVMLTGDNKRTAKAVAKEVGGFNVGCMDVNCVRDGGEWVVVRLRAETVATED